MGYSSRDATAGDVDEIVRVINLAYRVEDFFVIGDRTNRAEIEAWMREPGNSIIVVDSPGGRGLAACVCIDVHGGAGHFAMLSVDPSHQGRGIARILLSAVEEHCRSAGCDALQLEVVDLRTELPPFYERFGFQAAETVPFNNPHKLRREAHLVRMKKIL